MSFSREQQIRRAWLDLTGFASPATYIGDDDNDKAALRIPSKISVARIRREVNLKNAAKDLLAACEAAEKLLSTNPPAAMGSGTLTFIRQAIHKAKQ